jgi:hypothetical protein
LVKAAIASWSAAEYESIIRSATNVAVLILISDLGVVK